MIASETSNLLRPHPPHYFAPRSKGAKGKKSAGGGAAEGTLDYDSTDSFGLPKAKPKATPKGREQDPDPKAAHGEEESETWKTLAGAGRSRSPPRAGPSVTSDDGGEPGGIFSSRSPAPATSDWLSRDSTTTSSSSRRGRPSPAPVDGAAGAPGRGGSGSPEAAVAANPGARIDLADDFDSPDEDINELLEMTNPSAITKASARVPASVSASVSALGSASATMPPLLPLGGSTDSPKDDRKKPRERPPDATVSSPSPVVAAVAAVAAHEGSTTTLGSPAGEPVRIRSPSPPSSPREENRTWRSLRSRPGRGMTYSGSPDNLKGGGVSEESGGGGLRDRDGRSMESSSRGEVGPAATNASAAEGVRQADASPAGSPVRSSTSRAGSGGGRGEKNTEEGEAGRGARDGALEPNPQARRSGLEAPASAASRATTYVDAASSLEGKGGGGESDARRLLTSSGPGIAPKVSSRAPRRSALAGADKSKSQSPQPKSRGVTFDDDLAGVDALDILPGSSSDEAEKRGGGATPTAELPGTVSPSRRDRDHDSLKATSISTATASSAAAAAKPPVDPDVGGGGGDGGDIARALKPRATTSSSGVSRQSSASAMTEGLSPAAARLMAEDSSSEESHVPQASAADTMGSLLGLEDEDDRPGSPSTSAGGQGRLQAGTGAASLLGEVPKDGGEGEDMTTTDEARLDLALGFTPSSMDGGRKPRRALPAGRRRRPREGAGAGVGASPTTANAESKQASRTSSLASVPISLPETSSLATNMATSSLGDTMRGEAGVTGAAAAAAAPRVAGAAKDTGEARNSPSGRVSGLRSTSTAPVATASHVAAPSAGIAASAADTSTESSVSPAALSAVALPSVALPSNDSTPGANAISHGGTPGSFNTGPRHGGGGGGGGTSAIAASSRAENIVESRGVDVSVIASLERQLVLLAGEKEAVAARSARDEQRVQRDSDLARDAAAAAQAQAFESEAALAVARFVRGEKAFSLWFVYVNRDTQILQK